MKAGSDSGDSSFHEVLGRALTEPEYRARLMNKEDQAAALTEVLGAKPNADVLKKLNAAAKALDALAESFGGVKAAT